ncbi:pre-mRNA-splicing factor CWC25 homolog [Eutrema salsugineum]|uniref:pre-mRNA-splicing factor CWC25 homolog n=1 Tax=Eutrema salsugineum TaxID=72664 RepID=UPI000CED54A4|nr:pre-mRNA-splicing factor CWC25 homolog [Eutrema salsugineum]
MALKFLNKKGWHTGSLGNIEKVWKAEQKQEAEERKLEQLRLQIQQEKERSEFHVLEEQAGLVPRRPERLEFLYDSSYGVSSQNQERRAKSDAVRVSSNNKKQPIPGALFDDKAHVANDSWRKVHSDPLLLIRQHEQEARKSMKEKRKEKDGDTNKRTRLRV